MGGSTNDCPAENTWAGQQSTRLVTAPIATATTTNPGC
jgi:hypothetical protein